MKIKKKRIIVVSSNKDFEYYNKPMVEKIDRNDFEKIDDEVTELLLSNMNMHHKKVYAIDDKELSDRAKFEKCVYRGTVDVSFDGVAEIYILEIFRYYSDSDRMIKTDYRIIRFICVDPRDKIEAYICCPYSGSIMSTLKIT